MSNNNSLALHPLRDKAYQPTADITSTCTQTEMNDTPASLGLMCAQKVVCFLDRNYCYKSVTTQTPHDDIHWPENLPHWGLNQRRMPLIRVKSIILQTEWPRCRVKYVLV